MPTLPIKAGRRRGGSGQCEAERLSRPPLAAPSSVTSVRLADSAPEAPDVGVKETCRFADWDFANVMPAVIPDSENIEAPVPESVAERMSRLVSARRFASVVTLAIVNVSAGACGEGNKSVLLGGRLVLTMGPTPVAETVAERVWAVLVPFALPSVALMEMLLEIDAVRRRSNGVTERLTAAVSQVGSRRHCP